MRLQQVRSLAEPAGPQSILANRCWMIMELVIPLQLTCILISSHSFFFCQLLCLKCTCKDSVHQVTSYAANCFLYSFYSGKGQQRVHIKIKIAFNAAEKNQRSKRIKSRRRRAKGTRWFRKVWPPARSRPIAAQKDQVISLDVCSLTQRSTFFSASFFSMGHFFMLDLSDQ